MAGEEPYEVEEGELDFNDDENSADLSYIGDKVRSILGHFLKDFEGDLSSGILGARYGKYGSFLPMHQRSPHQPPSTTPPRVQTPNFPGLPNHIATDSYWHKSAFPVKMGSAPSILGPCPVLPQHSSGKASIQQYSVANLDRAKSIPQADERPLRTNPLKVRLKIPPAVAAQYDRLGLTTPWESSSEETVGSPVGSHETDSESPARILQMMTSFPVADSVLLSPLCDELLNKFNAVSSVHGDYVAKSSVNGFRFKKQETFGGGEKLENSVNRSNGKTPGGLTPECLMAIHDKEDKPMPDLVTDTENVVQLRKKRGSKDRMKGRPELSDSVKGVSLAQNLEQQNLRCHSAEKILRNRAQSSGKNNVVDDGQGRSSGNKKPAPIKGHNDTSDGIRFKRASNKPTAIGSQPIFDIDNLGSGHAVDDSVPEKKPITLRHRHVEHTGFVLYRPRSRSGRNKNSNLEPAKSKCQLAVKIKDGSTKKQYLGSLTSLGCMMEPSVAAISSNEGATTGQGASLLDDNWVWVCCDRCEKWRVLPYGTKKEELPDKWTCDMLDWLPGMNNCDVSEDETTKAAMSTHPPNTVSVSQYDTQAHAVNTNQGGILSGFRQNHESFNDQVKKQKVKETQMDVAPSGIKKKLQRLPSQTEGMRELNQPSQRDAKNTLGTAVAMLKKRKDGHVIDDDINPRKRLKKESADGIMKKIKVAGESKVDNSQKSGGILVTSGHGLPPGLSNKASKKDVNNGNIQQTAVKDVMKENTQKGNGKLQIHLKRSQYHMQDLSGDGALGIKECKSKTNLEDREDVQHRVQIPRNSGSYMQPGKVPMQEQKVGDFNKDKKSRVCQVEDKESKRCNTHVVLEQKGVESTDRSQGNIECTRDRRIDIRQQVRKSRLKGGITHEDYLKLQEHLNYEGLTTASVSSSSKISDTCKNKIKRVDMRSSTGDSVSSSSARIAYSNPVSSIMMVNELKTNSVSNDVSARGSEKSLNMIEGSEMIIARKGTCTGASLRSSGTPILDFQGTEARQDSCKLGSGVHCGHNNEGQSKSLINTVLSHKKPEQYIVGSTPKKISLQMGQPNDESCTDLRQADKNSAHCPNKHLSRFKLSRQRSSVDSRPSETSVFDDSSESLKDIMARESNLANKNTPNGFALQKAKSVLSEAEKLKSHADLMKKANFGRESNDGYFQAALKFLHGAYLLEACNDGSGKCEESNTIVAYATATELCKACATEYQKHEMAASALAYKCVAVCRMRLADIKRSSTQRVCLDLRSSLLIATKGESPSSSASDLDNLNNSAMADKVTLSKGNASLPGCHNIVARHRSRFLQLNDFAQDVISGMEATKISHALFEVACEDLKDSLSEEAIKFLKKAINFSYHDVDEFVRLVTSSLYFIYQQDLTGRGRD